MWLLRRLQKLERERTENLKQIAALLDENEVLKGMLKAYQSENRDLLSGVSRMESEAEIEAILKKVAG